MLATDVFMYLGERPSTTPTFRWHLWVCWSLVLRLGGSGVFLWYVALTCIQFVVLVLKISCWFACPLFLERAKISFCAGVLTSKSHSWCVIHLSDGKTFFKKSSSLVLEAAFDPSSLRRLKNVSRFWFDFCWTVTSWNRSNVVFRAAKC